VANIFTLPFSRSVWLASAGLIAVIGFLLHGAFNWENRRVTWSDMVLLAVGAVCQQGKKVPCKLTCLSSDLGNSTSIKRK
jgi:hypothetical protein